MAAPPVSTGELAAVTDYFADKVNAALGEYISSGAWKKSLDAWVAPSGYKIPDPPTPGK